MKRRSTQKKTLTAALSLALLGGAAALMSATPAEAHGNRGVRHTHVRGPAYGHPAQARHHRFVIPDRIYKRDRGFYRDYFLGVYHTPRYGKVRIYEFPVRRGRHHVDWVPHVYDRGCLVASGDWVYRKVIDRAHYDRERRWDNRYRDGFRRPRGASIRIGRDRDGDLDFDVAVRTPRVRVRVGDRD